MNLKLLLLPAAALGLTACVTPPVAVSTSKGVVTCQLYADDIVAWDRAESYPDGMSKAEADKVCQREGVERKPPL